MLAYFNYRHVSGAAVLTTHESRRYMNLHCTLLLTQCVCGAAALLNAPVSIMYICIICVMQLNMRFRSVHCTHC
jgi:hypothetical protein